MSKLLPGILVLPLLVLGGCSDGAVDQPAPVQLGVKLSFLENQGCAALPEGTLPAEATQVDLSLFLNKDSSPLQQVTLDVDPRARCRDAQGREFACPFDADHDGKRERYFAFDAQPVGNEVVLLVGIKDAAGTLRWSGRSAAVKPARSGGTLIPVTLHPIGNGC